MWATHFNKKKFFGIFNLFLPKSSKVHFSIWFLFMWQANARIVSYFFSHTKHHREFNKTLYSLSGCLYRKCRFAAPSDSYQRLQIPQKCFAFDDCDTFLSLGSSDVFSSGFESIVSEFLGFFGVFSVIFDSASFSFRIK